MRGVFSKGRPLASPVSWTGIYGFFLLTVFILWVPSSGYQNIVWPKHLLFLWATALFVLGLVPMVLIQKARQSLPERWTGADRLPLCLAAGLLLLFLLSALASPYPDVVWLGNRRYEGFLTLALYLVIFISAALWGRLGPLHVAGTALSALLVSALVLAQFLGKNPLGLYPPGLGFHDRGLKYSGEYLGTIGNSDLLSAYLTMACLYLWGAYAVSRSRVRLLYLSAGLAAWFALLLSEVAAGPAAVLGCLIICLPLCLAKGLGIRRMGEIFASLALGGLWKSVLGYEYQAGALTVFFSWGAEAWLLLAGVLLGLAATLLLRRLPEGRRLPKTALALTLAFLLLILAVLGFLYGYSGQQTSLQDLSQLLHGNPPPTLGSSRIAIWQEALELGLERPARAGHLPAPLQPDFHPGAAGGANAKNQRGRRPLRIPEPVGEHRACQYAPVPGAAGCGAPASGPALAPGAPAPAAARSGLCHTRPLRHQPKPGESSVLPVPGHLGPGQPACKITHVPRSGRIGLTGVIFMRKRDSIICLCAVALAVVLLLSSLPSRAVETGSWGLSFQTQGQAPVGSASQEALAQYDAAYLGDTSQPVLYLTFDAGYENGCTAQILDILKKHQAPAAFFLVGNYIQRNPELVKRMAEEGHIVGNHTAHHYDMSKIGDKATFAQELGEVEDLYRDVTGQELPHYYRPPQGIYSQENLAMAQELGYKTVFWSLAYVDWNNDSQPTREEAFAKLLPRIHNGAVVLLHSTSKTNAAILDELLTKWEEMGYRFDSVEALFS